MTKHREIKFRVWHPVRKIMELLEGYASFTSGTFEMDTGERNDVIMKFTGLLDKNGKEIYEGDIVIDTTPYQTESRGEVKYMDMGFVIDDKYGSPMHSFSKNYEIIGNIWETPSLLEDYDQP